MASEEQELQERIARLQGQIDQRRNGEPAAHHTHQRPTYPYPGANRHAYHPAHRGRGGFARGGLYRGAGRVRGNAPQFRNRVLVLNGGAAPTPTPDDSDDSGVVTPNDGWVAKVDRHKQLINAAIYEKVASDRNAAIEATRQQKLKQKDDREKARLQKHLQHAAKFNSTALPQGSTMRDFEMEVQGVRYRVANGGSKLVRLAGEVNFGKQTPKSAVVAGVVFRRSKNGNLYRATVIKSHRVGNHIRKVNKPCKAFSNLGTCAKGATCPFTHDVTKVAACKDLLFKHSCSAGLACPLSHELTPERTPHCHHFQKGSCTKESCLYPHVRISPTALVCSNFPVYGYCELGSNCQDKHVFECPDFSNTGKCSNTHCKLPHVHNAANMRRQAEAKGDESDVSSDEDEQIIDSDDIDSDEAEEFFKAEDGVGDTDFAEQRDFVAM